VPAVLRFDDRLVKKIGQIIDVPVGPQHNITAAPAVTAVGPAFGHKFFAPETNRAATAVAGLSENFNAIDEHGWER
jgi:hypothetical protein